MSLKYHPPASNPRKNLIFMDHHKKEPPSSPVPKVAETKQPLQVLHVVHTAVGGRTGPGRQAASFPKVAEIFRSCTLCVQGPAPEMY